MEIKYLYQHKRITLSFEEALQQIETSENILLYPMDLPIVTLAPTSLDIHDAIIVGTTLHLTAELRYKPHIVFPAYHIVFRILVAFKPCLLRF